MSKKNWKASIWYGPDMEERAQVFGSSIADLRQAAKAWLVENQPKDFGCFSPSSDLSMRTEYGYSDGTRIPAFAPEPLSEGWYFFPTKFSEPPELLESFEALADHFSRESLNPQTGPDYKRVPLVVDDTTQYHLIRQVRREQRTTVVNNMIGRGWTIVAIEYDGVVAPKGEGLENRHAGFVLAHTQRDVP